MKTDFDQLLLMVFYLKDGILFESLKEWQRIGISVSGTGKLEERLTMRTRKRIVLSAVIGLLIAFSTSAQVESENALQDLAKEFVPEGMQLAHKIVEGPIVTSPDTSSEKIVLLYRKDNIGGYDGLVLFPAGFEKFDTYKLPEPEFTWSLMEPRAVFFSNADSDPANELFIIERCMTGIGPDGAKYFYRTRVYDWQGERFVHLESVSNAIGTLKTASAIRKQLPAIVQRTKNAYQAMDIDELNKKLVSSKVANEPLQIISQLVGPFEEIRSRSLTMETESVEAESLKVVVTDDGLADDSVRAVQYKFDLRKNADGEWRVSSASKGWRCQKGRGHQDFSSKSCI